MYPLVITDWLWDLKTKSQQTEMIQREMFQLLEAELQDLWGFLPQLL